MCQTGLFHNLSNTCAVIAAATYRARGCINDAFVGGFFVRTSRLCIILSHDDYHIKIKVCAQPKLKKAQVDQLKTLREINATSLFNKWLGLEVESANDGEVKLSLIWRDELGQYSGFLHAALIGGLIDTACGFAAATVAGPKVLASNFTVNCLRPAVGEKFIAKGKVIKAGKNQIFTACDLFAINDGKEKLVANGQAILSVVG